MANYSFVIDSSFTPFTMQELLTPFAAYKEAFEKSEEEYQNISNNIDSDLAYLATVDDPNNTAATIYNNYVNDLNARAEELSKWGLGHGNRRALMGLKRRYSGEIGRLSSANKALKAEKELRRKMNATDPTMIYAANNMDINDFLDNNTPDLYSISGNSLYTRGANMGKAVSSREFGVNGDNSVLGGMYKDFVQTQGVSPGKISEFLQRDDVQQEINNILAEQGVTAHLSGAAFNQAKQSLMNGIYEGIVYSEAHNPQRDLTKLTAAERAQNAISWAGINLQKQQLERSLATDAVRMAEYGYVYDKDKKAYVYDEETAKRAIDRQTKLAATKAQAKGGGKSGSAGYGFQMKDPIKINPVTGEAQIIQKDNATKQYDFGTLYNLGEAEAATLSTVLPKVVMDNPDAYLFMKDEDDNIFAIPQGNVHNAGSTDDDLEAMTALIQGISNMGSGE